MTPSLDRAVTLLQHGNTPSAIGVLQQILANDPDNANAHALLCQALLMQLRIDSALYEANIALRLEPTNSMSHYGIAQCQLMKSQPQNALEATDEAIRLEPLDADNHLLKASCLQLLKKPDEALICIRKALELAPESVDALVSLGNHLLNTGELKASEDIAFTALSTDAIDPNAHLLMGRDKLRNGDTTGAREHAAFAIQQSPDNAEALMLFAEIKASENPIIGLWYKLNTRISKLPDTKLIGWLIGAFILFTFGSQLLGDLGFPALSSALSFTWIAVIAYSWIGLPAFNRMVQNEISKVKLSPDF